MIRTYSVELNKYLSYVLFLIITVYPTLCSGSTVTGGLFRSWSMASGLEKIDVSQRNYGVAVSDVNFDGNFDFIIAGFSGPNIVLNYNRTLGHFENIATKGGPFADLRDESGQAIGVAACDIDGDGREEIYFLNTNNAYAGLSSYSDKLFKWKDDKYVDLYADVQNQNISARNFAGRSVACLDRYGSGKYGFIISTYAHGNEGEFSLIEMDDFHADNDIEKGKIILKNCAEESGLKRSTGGRGVVVGPILNSHGRLDIFFGNEGNKWLNNSGDNYLFKNIGNGTYINVAEQYDISDHLEAARGVSLADFNNDGLLDIVCGNWDGPNRIHIQSINRDGTRTFIDVATPELQKRYMIRTVMVADFDNDKDMEIFINNINGDALPHPNLAFKVTSYGPGNPVGISRIPVGDAIETDMYGTGGAYADIDGDGMLELLLSHGEDVPQPLEIYKVAEGNSNNWIRIFPRTKYGGPARGATVKITTKQGTQLTQVIDSGSGYLCQMEPVGHFGLKDDIAKTLTVQWPDGKTYTRDLKLEENNRLINVIHPDYIKYQRAYLASNYTVIGSGPSLVNHTEL